MTERAGEIPVRMTLIWDFGPGAPARCVTHENNRYATLLLSRERRPKGFFKIVVFGLGESEISTIRASALPRGRWQPQRYPALRLVKTAFKGQIPDCPFFARRERIEAKVDSRRALKEIAG